MFHFNLHFLKTLALILFLIFNEIYFSTNSLAESQITISRYKAIVLGEMKNKKIKKSGGYYYTEYKLKPKNWLFRNPSVKASKNIKIKIFGADLKNKGLVIKSSSSPDYVPMNEEAIFFLEGTARREKDAFTITKGGIIYGEKLEQVKKQIQGKQGKKET